MVAPDKEMVFPPLVVRVPPQTVLLPLATVSPAGRTSVKATPANATELTAGFVMVKPSEVVAFTAIELGVNAFAIEGGATTTMLAEAAPPVPPSFDVTAVVVLFLVPAVVPVTFTLKVQDALPANVAPDRLITVVLCVAVIVPPPQDPVRPLGVEMTRPEGKVSLNPTPVSVVPLGLLMVKLRLVVPFKGMLAAPNALAIAGGPTTVIEAFEVLPTPPSVELTVTLLFLTPVVVPWILTETVHDPPAASVPPARLTEPEPLTAVAVPPQVLLRLAGVATIKPAGRLSVNAIPLAELLLGLEMENVRLVVPFSGMVAAPKALVMLTGLATLKLADAVLPVPPLVEVTLPVVLVNWPDAVPVTVTEN